MRGLGDGSFAGRETMNRDIVLFEDVIDPLVDQAAHHR
jgi:hypothetical protein